MTLRELGAGGVTAAVLLAVATAYAAARAPVAAIGALAAVVFVTWVVTKAELVLMVVVAAVPWEAMLEYPSATVSAVKLLGAALVIAYLFRGVTRAQRLRFPRTLLVAIAFGMAIGLSLMASADPVLGLSKALRYAFFLLFLFLVTQLVDSRETALRVLKVLVVSTTAAAVYGLVAFLSGSIERAAGPLSDANDFAYLIATVIPVCALLVVDDRRRRVVWASCLAVLVAATLATLSRGALVGIGALAVWALASRRVGPGGLLTTALVIGVVAILGLTLWSPVINERVESKERIAEQNVDSRLAFWAAAGRMALDHPVFGVGPDRFGEEADEVLRNNPLSIRDPVVHNSYLEVLAENGVLALMAFVALLVSAWRAVARAERSARSVRDAEGAHLAAAVKGMLVVAVVSGCFLSEQLTLPFWLACGIAGSGAFAVAGSTRRASRPPLTAL